MVTVMDIRELGILSLRATRGEGQTVRSDRQNCTYGRKKDMKAEMLREMQAPFKALYREVPEKAVITLKAKGRLGSEGVTCKVETGRALVEAGLHPATGADGLSLCSCDMLLEARVACARVTMQAVATALDVPLNGGTVSAQGDPDFRGTP